MISILPKKERCGAWKLELLCQIRLENVRRRRRDPKLVYRSTNLGRIAALFEETLEIIAAFQ